MEKKIHFPGEFPLIETERLTLRSMSLEDVDAFYALRSDRDFMQYMGRYPMKEVAESEKFIQSILRDFEERKGIKWKICLKGKERMIGYTGFWRIEYEHFQAEVGFGLSSEYQSKGYMAEALHAILTYGFKEMRFHAVMADIDSRNLACEKLLNKVGFQKEAHFKENFYFDGGYLDSIIYRILEANFHY